MSPRTSDRSNPSAGPYRKPRADVYTMLLLMALLAMVIGTVVLYLETQEYGPQPFGAAWPNSSTGIVPVVAAATGETVGRTRIVPAPQPTPARRSWHGALVSAARFWRLRNHGRLSCLLSSG